MTSDPRARRGIWLQTTLFIGAYAGATAILHVTVTRRWFELTPLSIAVAFALLQVVLIAAVFAYVLLSRFRDQVRDLRARRIMPTVRRHIAAHSIGKNRVAALRRLQRLFPDEVERCLVESLATLSGESLDNVEALVEPLGRLDAWRRQYRTGSPQRKLEAIRKLGLLRAWEANEILFGVLEDDDDSAHVEAARALIRRGRPADIAKVFTISTRRSLMVRALLANDLRAHASGLASAVITRILADADERAVLNALQMIASWRVSLPLDGLRELLRHDRAAVRAAALRIVPLSNDLDAFNTEVLAALTAEEGGERAAAAAAAGRLRLGLAIPRLKQMLADDDRVAALAAAYALTHFQDIGMQLLEGELMSGSQRGAPVALEALARQKTMRLDEVAL